MRTAALVCGSLAAAHAFAPAPAPGLRSSALTVTSMASQFKGFGKEVKKAGQTNSDPKTPVTRADGEGLSVEEVGKMVGEVKNIPEINNSEKAKIAGGPKVVNRQKRADPVNLDGGAMLDVGWVKNSVDTVFSDEWKNAAKDEAKMTGVTCDKCGGSGRIQGGLGAIPLFEWWPIKAFRPCPECEEAGRSYRRRGQVLDEVLFGSTDMPIDYEAKPDNRGLTSDEVKKIMKKREKSNPKNKK